jgi:outer membrane protein assembly factor BamB
LPQFEKPKAKKGDIEYSGPVLAGNRLILTSASGQVIQVDPATGNFQSQFSVGDRVSLPPVVAGSTLYVLDDAAKLHAYR